MILDGNKLALQIQEEIKDKIKLVTTKNKPIKLSVILVGDDMASQIYVAGKMKACSRAGIKFELIKMPAKTTQNKLEKTIKQLNDDKEVTGILLQLPLPHHLNSSKALNCILPDKDVDGLTDINLGRLFVGDTDGLIPCTPRGVMLLLGRNNIDLVGKRVAMIGRSNLVGKPLSILLTKANATVTLCHTKTVNLPSITKQSDIVITAVGKRNFITANMIKKGAVVVDIGINRNEQGKVCGDVDFVNVSKKASAITPVPGGVGPMTIAMLMNNLVIAYERQKMSKKSN